MIVDAIHSWSLDYRRAAALQDQLKERIVLFGSGEGIRLVAGADVSYEKWGDLFYAAVVVMDIETFEVIDSAHHVSRVGFPYIPGLLSFREGPIVLSAFEKLSTVPQAAIFDGQGIAHPRRFGLAAHMGLLLGIPSAGCAKTRLVGEHGEVKSERGSSAPLIHNNETVGYVVRTKEETRPVFVSPGNLISCEGAVGLVLSATGRYRIPEPIRAAHILVNRLRKEKKSRQ